MEEFLYRLMPNAMTDLNILGRSRGVCTAPAYRAEFRTFHELCSAFCAVFHQNILHLIKWRHENNLLECYFMLSC